MDILFEIISNIFCFMEMYKSIKYTNGIFREAQSTLKNKEKLEGKISLQPMIIKVYSGSNKRASLDLSLERSG